MGLSPLRCVRLNRMPFANLQLASTAHPHSSYFRPSALLLSSVTTSIASLHIYLNGGEVTGMFVKVKSGMTELQGGEGKW